MTGITKEQIKTIECRIQAYIAQANEYFYGICRDAESGTKCEFAANVIVETMNLLGCDYDIRYDRESNKLYLKGGIADD